MICVNCERALTTKLITFSQFQNKFLEEDYCDVWCRVSHEKKLIMDGILEKPSIGLAVMVDSTVRDLSGEKIYFPKDSTSYFDPALRKNFSSIHEKKAFMDKHKLIMDGSSDESSSKKSSMRDTCIDEYRTRKEKEKCR